MVGGGGGGGVKKIPGWYSWGFFPFHKEAFGSSLLCGIIGSANEAILYQENFCFVLKNDIK
jgi:hypothetical protein